MKNKISTVRYKLILAFFTSAVMAGLCMIIICVILFEASRVKPFAIFFVKNYILFSLLLFIILILLMIGFFLLLTKNKIVYLEDIIKTLETISNGNLEVNIPVKSSDELGKLATTVNSMVYKLKILIEEEKSWEKTKNDLITNLSHDLRTPLTSILGYMGLIANIQYTDEESLNHYANITFKKCNELKVLIDSLFEYSKLTNPGLKINKSMLNLGELLEQVILGFIPLLKESKMEYRLFFSNEKIIINADPILLVRVFENLINNAVKYGSEGKYLDIELSTENSITLIRIINYGKPIFDKDMPFIFERFYKADKSRFEQKNGSGLGLAIVKSIIELHKGTVTVSNLDNRTIFEIRFRIDVSNESPYIKQ
ncbi:sensor histidine kinase [Clostridium estertheticum]|uniref:HAMP domain-containing sensor histidine kinase n=1 Tax=Clostridium estertheticum TaxID=238834 RepID=UPI001CF3D0B9|nr:HAMP domain-containing sensor histidine kinase [Clostridium estertheticum]MCB2356449.1 HAMP domain-containing histidine kinase [Clostridium estertheticum]WAG43598.1 HAMP domain-containing histidine kinase [Clostridium estertheticum]